MKKNISEKYFLLGFACLLFFSCASNPIASDLTGYINRDILRISEMETESLKRYSDVTGINYTSDVILIKTLNNDIIPVYRRFLDLLKKIRPQTDEVHKLHITYVNGSELIYRGLTEILGGVTSQDEDMIRAGNSKIETGRIENERWRKELFELFGKYGINDKLM